MPVDLSAGWFATFMEPEGKRRSQATSLSAVGGAQVQVTNALTLLLKNVSQDPMGTWIATAALAE
jgi:hypothetical protein